MASWTKAVYPRQRGYLEPTADGDKELRREIDELKRKVENIDRDLKGTKDWVDELENLADSNHDRIEELEKKVSRLERPID